jgi:hypothetical protein
MTKLKASSKSSRKFAVGRGKGTATSLHARQKGVAGSSKTKKSFKQGERTYRIVGETSDGVKILAANVKPKHFTSSQIRAAITAVAKPASTRS